MTPPSETTAESFVRYHRSAASRLRYQQAQHNMEALHDLDRPQNVLDAAGGNGLNTAWLAGRGHTVTLLDSDSEMLEQADRRLRELGLRERCELVEGTLEGIGEQLPADRFDLILCHHAIEYTNDCLGIFRGFGRVAAPTGEVSLITLNPVSEVVRAIVFRRDPVLARTKLNDLSYDAKWFGNAKLYSLEQIESWCVESGWSVRDFRAIRVLADYIPQDDLDAEREEQLLGFEEDLAAREPYRRFGRYFQFCLARGGG